MDEHSDFSTLQRDEVRDLRDVSAAICAQPGMKQQTFLAKPSASLTPWDVQSRRVHDESGAWPALYGGEGGGHGYAATAGGAGTNCLTPWDTQQSRVFTTDGVAPTAAGADGQGGRNPASLVFCPEPGRHGPDTAQALTSADGNGARNPPGLVFCRAPACGQSAVTVVNDQGGDSMSVERTNISPTLRSQTHGNLPIIAGIEGNTDGGKNMPAITMRMREGCDGGGKGPLCQVDKSAALATRGDQYLFAPAVSVHQDGSGALTMAGTAKSLTTKGDGDCFLSPESHPALSQGGGQAGQGYPAVLAERSLLCAATGQANAEICEDICPTITEAAGTSGNNKPYIVHPDVSGTLCASGAGLSRPAGMASEPDLCVAYALHDDASPVPAIPINDKATRYKGGGPTRNGDGSGNGLGVGKPGGPAPTLTSGDHHAAAIPINTQLATRHGALGEGTGLGVGKDTDPAYTIQQARGHAVAAVFNRQRSDQFKAQYLASTQAARQHKDATDLVCEAGVSAVDCRNYKEAGDISGTLQAKDKPGYSLNYQNPVRTGYIVRRLTPTECERLQGFPDGWTRFGHDGREISDTKRYQMLGNSVAVPCVRYILHGMAAQMLFGGHRQG